MQTQFNEVSLSGDLDQDLLFKRLVENMNEAVWVIDEDQRTLYVNPQFCKLMCFSFEEIVGYKAYDFLDETSRKWVKRVDKIERASGISSTYEVILINKFGEKLPVSISGAPLADGKTMAIITDLRNRKWPADSPLLVKEELLGQVSDLEITQDLNKEFLFQRLVENMNEAVWVIAADQKTVYVNPRFCKMMGCALEEVVGLNAYVFFDDASRNRVNYIDKNHRSQGVSSSYEATLLSKTGEEIPVLISGSPINNGNTVGIITDLREVKKREEQERLLNMAISYSSDGIIVVNQSGIIQSWNKGAKSIFGFSEEQTLGNNLSLIFDVKEVGEILTPERIQYRLELPAIHYNKQKIIVSATINPIVANQSESQSTMFLLILRDITNERKFEEELSLKYQKMRAAYNDLGVIRRQMDYVFDLVEICNSYDKPHPFADFMVSSLIMITRADGCLVRCLNKTTGMLEMLSSFGMGESGKVNQT
ncbi:MAG: PAS domain-containing protein [Proteobacteria bacterium]|nr:PAS domain-containing protein [Pseudomonadota bacterium]